MCAIVWETRSCGGCGRRVFVTNSIAFSRMKIVNSTVGVIIKSSRSWNHSRNSRFSHRQFGGHPVFRVFEFSGMSRSSRAVGFFPHVVVKFTTYLWPFLFVISGRGRAGCVKLESCTIFVLVLRHSQLEFPGVRKIVSVFEDSVEVVRSTASRKSARNYSSYLTSVFITNCVR